jgi:hypothetical protein
MDVRRLLRNASRNATDSAESVKLFLAFRVRVLFWVRFIVRPLIVPLNLAPWSRFLFG